MELTKVALSRDDITEIRKNKVKRALFVIAMIIIPLINFFVFYLYVNFSSILMAFQDVNGNLTLEILGRLLSSIGPAHVPWSPSPMLRMR